MIRDQPSTSTNSINLNGNDTIIGDNIIIPIAIRIDATTRSMIRNGKNSIKPIWNAVFNSLTIKAGITTLIGTFSSLSILMLANSKAMLSKLRSLKKSLAISSVLTLITGLILFLLPTQSIAANLDISAFTVKTNPDGTQDYSLSLQVVILMTLLSFLPSILVMMTSFTRIVIVLAILRQAIGLQTSPSNQVLIGIAFFMTIFVMTPVFDDMYTQAIEPYMNDKIQARDAFEIAMYSLDSIAL